MRTTALLTACLLTASAWAQAGGSLTPPAPRADAAPFDKGAADDLAPIPGLTDKFDRPSSKVEGQLLGPAFNSQVAGLAFRPPLHCKQVAASDADHTADHIVDYTDDDRQWLLKVTRARLAQPMPLQTVRAPGNDRRQDRQGLLDYTVADVLKMNPAAETLRQDIFNVGDKGVGLAIMRFNLGNQRYLRQQAIYQVDEQTYYIFNLTTPAAKAGKVEENPAETLAVETFKAMIETIEVRDRAWIRTDQDNRLFRTRALFTIWGDKGGKRIKQAVVPQQWLRIVRDGKDIGYTYRFEEFTEGKNIKGNPARAFDGVLIGMRSRIFSDDTVTDSGTQMFVSLDRKHEDWATVMNVVSNPGQANQTKKQSNEYGFSETKLTRVVNRNPDLANKEPIAHDVETYKLSVNHPRPGQGVLAPEYYIPSPWYIPQAVGAMLPRLLPLNRGVTYLFQSYIGEDHEVVHRYIDVGFQKAVQLDGRVVQAIPITDRFRLEGTPTVHYMSPEGEYLGSVTEYNKVRTTILPAAKTDLERIWPDEKIWPVKDEANDKLVPAAAPQPAPGAAESSPGLPASLGR